ncbi:MULTISPECIES: Bug family tripartite tricarboxylate transporter substrate binding protein [Achromobacter]|jgi:tripartite-type tricarboxylate transporter receptor subunit TctC|uniref:Tripartite tricarboxylate transporter substrate binding protein n=1 Tax=Achromobacter denitrificans TaxID=32002 RepID=A0A3R9G2W1_ACHDE|nr:MULTISPECIES: tripartite tricarboxylate transporter substrate binding protein [Achromobacter]ASC65108.1 tripartite tricarboxylate transporter substrate binding protein [Achromobacter denitrificans]OLU09828.1 LacI family transcriptional regulator [Achromobacter denitrificans]QCS63464.1 tripartite tricarboxylate transporter substrate binding protein [Achromobacter denitrificans]QKH43775.1 tripartite tricarboxylate transporter substrate binding protein [Achromobacter denitrificans]QKH49084.1 t
MTDSFTHAAGAGAPLRRKVLALLACAAGIAAAPAFAQSADTFPTRPVTIVVPFPAGGATDITARLVAEGLSKKWGQAVVVENKPGAGGNVGSEYVARAAPDGYTLVLGVTGSHGINTSLYKNMRYDPVKDFEAVTQATLYPNAIIVNNDVPANNLQELIALLKKPDAHYSYGSDGNGTASHLGMELIKNQGKFEISHIPYRGSSPMVTDLLGGQIQVGITGLPAVQAYAKSGKLKIVALTTADRFASAPDYPTVAEQGFAGYAAPPWSGFFAPKGTPKALVEKISADMREVMSDPKAKEKMIAAGSEFTPSTPAEFQAFVQKEIAKWAEAVKISGARID